MFVLYVTFQSPCRAHKLVTSTLTWDGRTSDVMPVLGSSSSWEELQKKKKNNTEKSLTDQQNKILGFLTTLGVFSPNKLTILHLHLILCWKFQTVVRKISLKLTSFPTGNPGNPALIDNDWHVFLKVWSLKNHPRIKVTYSQLCMCTLSKWL